MERTELFKSMAPKRTIPFFGRLNAELYGLVREQLLDMSAASSRPITILFDSPGGGMFLCFQLGDLIKMLPCKVIGVVLEALSAGCMLLQFCEERKICASGRVLVHQCAVTVEDNFPRFVNDEFFKAKMAQFTGALEDGDRRLSEILSKRTGFSEDEVRKWMREGENLTHSSKAEEALARRLVDAIIPDDFKLFSGSKEF